MNDILSEKDFQHFIMERLVRDNGYLIRHATKEGGDYDRKFAMDRELFFRFLRKTQSDSLDELRKIYKDKTEETIINTINQEILKKGSSLDTCLRGGVDMGYGITLKLLYTKPGTEFNKELNRLYKENIFSIMEEVYLNDKERVDLVIFLNGLAIISFELKCNLAGQSYEDAIYQYRHDRDPKNRLFLFKAGCLVNFAMDLKEVYMATKLAGPSTFFLPFNKGKGIGINRGKGNDINPKTGFGVDYMWKDILKKDTLLDLITKYVFVEVKEKEDPDTKEKKVKETLIFPRYHQLDCVRSITADVKEHGTRRNYLINHSAGSGKTNTIIWLAYRFSSLHDDHNHQIFDKTIIVTDRVVVDRQLQRAVLNISHKSGMVRVMDDKCNSGDLKNELDEGKAKIIGTTIQKFPYIVDALKSMKQTTFAVIIDEAHSSTAGKDMAAVMKALGKDVPDIDEELDEKEKTDLLISKEISSLGKPENVSFFGFTATPKATTLAMFGQRNEHGQIAPFHLYSMKQAIEEGFILDVLNNYTTYQTFYKINKTIESDPRYKSSQAKKKIARFAALHPTNIAQRLEIIVEHFREYVKDELGGQAKAMVITSSRQEAVKYRNAFDEYIKRKEYNDIRALVAFSGTVKEGNREYTESGMNGFPESKTADEFDKREYQVLLVANKYQTGFDQDKLCAMYILKKLRGVNAVQTLSRLNRICPPYDKKVFVLDFVNSYEDMQNAFAPYYSGTILSSYINPGSIYDMLASIDAFYILDPVDIDKFNDILYEKNGMAKEVSAKQRAALLRYLNFAVDKIKEQAEDRQKEFTQLLRSFHRFYSFLMMIAPLDDVDLYKKYRFIDYLLPFLKQNHPGPGFDLKGKIDAGSFVQKFTGEHKNKKPVGKPVIKLPTADPIRLTEEKEEKLSEIIKEINSQMGTNFNNDVAINSALQVRDILMQSDDLKEAAKSNSEKEFEYVYYDQLKEALVKGWAQNKEFYSLLLKNPDMKKKVMGIFADSIYHSLRGDDKVTYRMAKSESTDSVERKVSDNSDDGMDKT